MKATTDDWAKLETAAQAWGHFRCILDLRRRVEALEARAAAEESSATEPAPAADRLLWVVMVQAWRDSETFESSPAHRYAGEIDAVADWLAAREHCGAASALRAEARRAREGA